MNISSSNLNPELQTLFFSPGPPASTILYLALSTPKNKPLIFFPKTCSFHDLSDLLRATSSLPLLRPKPGATLVDTFAPCLSQQQILLALPGSMSRIQSLSPPPLWSRAVLSCLHMAEASSLVSLPALPPLQSILSNAASKSPLMQKTGRACSSAQSPQRASISV